jgi:hypothetical protein
LAREIALIHCLDETQTFNFSTVVGDDAARESLKAHILNQLIHQPLLRDDEQIRFGIGGCKPRYRDKAERQAIILLGLPASGKSTVAQVMSDIRGAYLIDSDIAKRKFPEFNFPNGATWVHEESSHLIHGEKSYSVIMHCIHHQYNLVIPKIGSSIKSITDILETLIDFKYEVTLGLVDLPKGEAVKRAIIRYRQSKRYVPIKKILESQPELTFHELKNHPDVHSTIHLSSDVERHQPYEIIHVPDNCIWW